MKPHVHRWHNSVTTSGDTIRGCETCDEVQVRVENGYRVTRPGMMSALEFIPADPDDDPVIAEPSRVGRARLPGTGRRGASWRGMADLVEDHGGIVSFDPRTELISTADGTSFTLEALEVMNPGVSHRELLDALKRFPRPRPEPDLSTLTAGQLERIAAMTRTTGKSMDEIAEAFRKLGSAMPSWAAASGGVSGNPPTRKWTSEDALTLILEEIKHADDPFKAGGEWITKITNAITGIIRNLDDEHE